MTILITGASGLLGRKLYDYLLRINSIKVIGTYNTTPYKNLIYVDFLNTKEVETLFVENDIKICINCIAKRYLDVCENNWNLTYKTNVEIPNILAKLCYKYRVHLIHISTDYVFDGKNKNGNYPDSLVNPLQNYGITKFLAEQRIRCSHNIWTIIRVPVIYSDKQTCLEESSVTTIGKKILNRLSSHHEDNYFIRRPLYISDLIPFIHNVITDKILGIKHFYNPYNKLTKYDIGEAISKLLNKKCNLLPVNQPPNDQVERPEDTYLLDNTLNINSYIFTNLDKSFQSCFNNLIHPSDLSDTFLLLDLDGTLIDTDKIHYNCYKQIFDKDLDKYFFDYSKFDKIINTTGIDYYLDSLDIEKNKIKNRKQELIVQITKIDLIQGAEYLINYISQKKINHAVVTNTNLITVEKFKSICPVLNLLTNWITREDYKNSKPNSECYKKAKDIYYKGEKYIIGVENTLTGLDSLDKVTKCKYLIVSNKNCYAYTYNKNDVYIIDNLVDIIM
jgi:dTDP-4-dehydrorhamnose reductase